MVQRVNKIHLRLQYCTTIYIYSIYDPCEVILKQRLIQINVLINGMYLHNQMFSIQSGRVNIFNI